QMFSFEDNRVRFCSLCNLNVYNLSGMSRNEAETLITKTEGRLCVRYYRRADGSILTQNCPVGLKVIKRRVVWLGQVFHGMVLSLLFILGPHNLSLAKKLLDAKRALPIDSHPEPIEMVGVVLYYICRRPDLIVKNPGPGRSHLSHRSKTHRLRSDIPAHLFLCSSLNFNQDLVYGFPVQQSAVEYY